MKEIVIISGKGGTGKTSITGTLASLVPDSLFADCDVDAADLHLILNTTHLETHDFFSGHEASINQDNCIRCGQCHTHCRYEAIQPDPFRVLPHACEGCGVCAHLCPVGAIDLTEQQCGQWFVSQTKQGLMVHAKLGIAAENSGKLVTQVRNEARRRAEASHADWVIIDGPPGTGCPVIASVTGTDAVLIVTEPTPSGKHDLLRVLQLTQHFSIPAFVSINKWDINPDMAADIETVASQNKATILPRIPFDATVTHAQLQNKSVAQYPASIAYQAIKSLWNQWQQAMSPTITTHTN